MILLVKIAFNIDDIGRFALVSQGLYNEVVENIYPYEPRDTPVSIGEIKIIPAQ